VLGANGVAGEFHILRHAANLESTFTYEGTDQIHTLSIGRALTGLSAF
jgi:glutaryl-CoA dehydrogenase